MPANLTKLKIIERIFRFFRIALFLSETRKIDNNFFKPRLNTWTVLGCLPPTHQKRTFQCLRINIFLQFFYDIIFVFDKILILACNFIFFSVYFSININFIQLSTRTKIYLLSLIG